MLLNHSCTENVCFLSMFLSCTLQLLELASTSADIGLIWMANHMYFCEIVFVLLHLLPEPTNDCTGFLVALSRDRGSNLLVSQPSYSKSSLALSLLVVVFTVLFRGLSTVTHIQRLKILWTANSAEAGKEKEILKRWTGRKLSWSKTS